MSQDFAVPLLDPLGTQWLGSRTAGALARTAGGWVDVKWNSAADKLVVGEQQSAGQYDGNLVFSEDPAKTYAFTVFAKDIVVLLVIVIGGGDPAGLHGEAVSPGGARDVVCAPA